MKKIGILIMTMIMLSLVACGNANNGNAVVEDKTSLIPFASDVDWNTTLTDIKTMYGNPDAEGELGGIPAIQYNNKSYGGYTGTYTFGFSDGRLVNASFKVVSDSPESAAEVFVKFWDDCKAEFGEASKDAPISKTWENENAIINIRGLGVNTIIEYFSPDAYVQQ